MCKSLKTHNIFKDIDNLSTQQDPEENIRSLLVKHIIITAPHEKPLKRRDEKDERGDKK